VTDKELLSERDLRAKHYDVHGATPTFGLAVSALGSREALMSSRGDRCCPVE
jgi:hypothetical protein